MSSKQEDENYWHRSDFTPFSFDDEELTSKNYPFGSTVSTSFVTDIIFDGVPTVEKPQIQKRPLESLIPKESLSKIFGESGTARKKYINPEEELKILRRQVDNKWVPASVSKTVGLILTGQKYSLHLYRSLQLKKELLDEAIKSGDGNAVLAIIHTGRRWSDAGIDRTEKVNLKNKTRLGNKSMVEMNERVEGRRKEKGLTSPFIKLSKRHPVVLFLSSTLKKSIFYQVLQSRPAAVAQYVQYLSTRVMVSELIDLLEMLGQTRESAMKQFTLIVQGIQSKETRLQRLNTCYNSHFSQSDSKDKQFVQDYFQYLKWTLSLDSGLRTAVGDSVLSSLSYLCKNHWTEPRTSKVSPWFLSSQQNVADRQLQWVILRSRASIQSWEDIETHFLTKGWIVGKKLKTVIPVEKIIVELSHQGAPYNILVQYLDVIGNLEKRLELAKQLPCHRAVIDILIQMKDRQGIVDYKMSLKPQSEDILYAENALRSQIKWKN